MTITLRSVWLQPDETLKLEDDEQVVSHKFIFDNNNLRKGVYTGRWLLLVAKTRSGINL